MIRSKRFGFALTAMALIGTLLSGCAAKSGPAADSKTAATAPAAQEKVTLHALWWGDQTRADLTQKAIAAYTAKHPNITIVSEFSDWSTYWDKVSVHMASGDAPDLLQMDYGYIADYAGRKALLDLTPYVGKQLNLSNMDKALIDAGKLNGGLYGISLGGNVMAMVVNKTLVEKAGLQVPADNWTWTDFANYAKQVKDKLGKDYWFTADQSYVMDYFGYWLRQQGKPGTFQNGTFAFTAQDLAAYWKWWDDLRKAGVVPDGNVTAANGGYNPPLESSLWTKQKSGTWFGWTAEGPKYKGVIKDEMAVVPFPGGGTAPGSYAKPSMYWSVPTTSKHPQEAADFISWFINDPEAAAILGTTRGVPVTTTARDTLTKAGLKPDDQLVFDKTEAYLKTAGPTPEPIPKGGTDLQTLFKQLSEQMSFGKITPDAAAQQFMTQGLAILQKANGK